MTESNEKNSRVMAYLKKVGKLMILFVILGCVLLTFAVWLVSSVISRNLAQYGL
ncbi:MAG: hypothetical protein IPM23_14370 [Candidatus Melainabacteria bacterium]|nr:hypothetical protein [Candidatus Melainabacteria bacterium]